MTLAEQKTTKPKKRIWPTLITLSIIALLVAVAISSLPRTISTDFSIVGKGSPVVVLLYDPNILKSSLAASVINEIRDNYTDRVEFIVVQFGSPTGSMLSHRYHLDTTAFVLFDSHGEALKILRQSPDATLLKYYINLIFKLEK